MKYQKKISNRLEFQGGFDSAMLGLATALGPILFFSGFFGSQSLAAAYWATLVTAIVMPSVWLLLRGSPAINPGTRAASLTAYVSLVLLLSLSMGSGPRAAGLVPTASEFLLGLAGGSLMFALASCLILLAGALKLGNVFKMIPNTVTAGISNSTAILLVWLALKQVMGSTWASALSAVVMVTCFIYWPKLQTKKWGLRLKLIPAAVVALLVGWALSRGLEPVVQGGPVVGALDASWVSIRLWPELLQHNIGNLLLVGLPGTVTLALVMILETFTAASVMEARFGLRTNANRELLVLGGANLAGAILGGVPCTGSTLRSVASWNAGGRGVLAAVLSLTTTGVLLVTMGNWLLALSAGVVAGLFLVQSTVMFDPAFKKRLFEMLSSRKWRGDAGADLGFWITFVISVVGFLGSLIWACFLGIGLSCLAVLRRLSANLTAHWVYLDHYRSRRVRSPSEAGSLAAEPHQVGILRLTGHLFFGNSKRLIQLVDELHPDARAIVVDVSQIADVDSSGTDALTWVVRVLKDRGLTVIVTGLERTKSRELRHTFSALSGLNRQVDMDRGLEVCEDLVLQKTDMSATSGQSTALAENSLLRDLNVDEVTAVLMLGESRTVAQGDVLFHRDTPANGVWLLESGLVSILSNGRDNASRLSTFGAGQFVGEMGFVDGKTRSATARADTKVSALLFDKDAITALLAEHPESVLKITRNIARELSYRVRNSSAQMTDETTEESSGWANSSLSILSRF